jgi:hypothetical protein
LVLREQIVSGVFVALSRATTNRKISFLLKKARYAGLMPKNPMLTTDSGASVADNQNSMTAGPLGTLSATTRRANPFHWNYESQFSGYTRH